MTDSSFSGRITLGHLLAAAGVDLDEVVVLRHTLTETGLRSRSDLSPDVIDDSRYAAWRTALGAVQGVYLIADSSTGQCYVGKADGGERILGRWAQYARDGHGGNVALRELGSADASHARSVVFSILRVFGPSVPTADVTQAEAHFKRALLTREHGLNRN